MLETEQISPRYKGIDTWPSGEIALSFWEAQMRAITSVKPALPIIERAASAIAQHLSHPKSRLVYVGAGASGLLAMQDAMEMTPTFGWPLERMVFLMAGGDEARLRPTGISEDDQDAAANDLEKYAISEHDVVIALAASGTTPYTVYFVSGAKSRNALVVSIANNPDVPLLSHADFKICLRSGAEVIAGSTRLNAGTAQKCALGILSSMMMMNRGHVVDGMMVSVIADNAKLDERAISIVETIAEVNKAVATDAIGKAEGSVKKGVLLALGCGNDTASNLLERCNGNLREAMSALK